MKNTQVSIEKNPIFVCRFEKGNAGDGRGGGDHTGEGDGDGKGGGRLTVGGNVTGSGGGGMQTSSIVKTFAEGILQNRNS